MPKFERSEFAPSKLRDRGAIIRVGLALAAARFERERSRQQLLLFIGRESAIPPGLLLCPDGHAKSMEGCRR
jgi:hypothetical protein